MDGIDRYFQPNTLDGLSIYETPEALLVDGSNAMQADADMGGHNVKNVATAVNADEAVNLGQFNAALAGKADDSLVVHKANAETITGIKTFNALPETVLTPTTDSQLINRGTALSYIPYSDIGYVSYYDQSDATRPLSYGLYLTGTVPHGTNGLRMAAYSRNNLYGATVMLHARHYYNYIMLRWEQTLQNTYVTIGIYDGNGILVSSTLRIQLAKLGSGTGEFNGAIALQTPFQPTLTGCYVIVLHLSSATSSNNFLEAEACNSDILSNLLGTAGCTQRYLQKGWYYVLNSSTWTPPSSLASYNSGIVTSSKCLWLGLLYSVVAPP